MGVFVLLCFDWRDWFRRSRRKKKDEMRLEKHLKQEEWEWECEAGVVSLATRLEKYTVDTPYIQSIQQ